MCHPDRSRTVGGERVGSGTLSQVTGSRITTRALLRLPPAFRRHLRLGTSRVMARSICPESAGFCPAPAFRPTATHQGQAIPINYCGIKRPLCLQTRRGDSCQPTLRSLERWFYAQSRLAETRCNERGYPHGRGRVGLRDPDSDTYRSLDSGLCAALKGTSPSFTIRLARFTGIPTLIVFTEFDLR